MFRSCRAASRMNTQLTAALYDKALRITDQSGVVSKKNAEENNADEDKSKSDGKDATGKKDTKKGKNNEGEKDESDSEGDASVGKIVNLMSIDCRRLWEQVSAMPHIYVSFCS
jgi:hypothetical protein